MNEEDLARIEMLVDGTPINVNREFKGHRTMNEEDLARIEIKLNEILARLRRQDREKRTHLSLSSKYAIEEPDELDEIFKVNHQEDR